MRSAILTYHSLDNSGSVISVSPQRFAEEMQALAETRVPVVPLEQIRSTPGSVALTFDDGFENFASHAVPVLERHDFCSTVFVVSEFCGTHNDWPDQPPGIVPRLPLLDWKDLSALPPSVALGAHGATHRNLRSLSILDAAHELIASRDRIEQQTGRAVTCLAYPYGDSTPEVRSTAAKHYSLAAGTRLGFLTRASDPFDLPRIDACYLRGAFSARHLFSAAGGPYIAFRGALREMWKKAST